MDWMCFLPFSKRNPFRISNIVTNMNSQALCGAYVAYTLQSAFFGGSIMSEENIPIITAENLRTQLQTMDDHVILTIVLTEGDDDDAKE